MTSLRKRLGTIATTSLIVLSASSALATPAWASPFVDIPSGHWVEASGVLDEALTEGIINGSTNENGVRIFRPDDSITRVEVASMLMNLAGVEDGAYGKVDTTSWADASSNVWYTSVLNWAEETGVLNGSNGYVRPNDKITREEIATMLGNFERTLGDSDAKGDVISLNSYEDGSQVSSWAQETVAWAVESEIMGATANLYPTSNATRAEATKMVVVLGNLGEQTDAAPTPEPEPEPEPTPEIKPEVKPEVKPDDELDGAVDSTPDNSTSLGEKVASIALQYEGTPYLYGGENPEEGFDCSGLVMYVYAQLGYDLPHSSSAQRNYFKNAAAEGKGRFVTDEDDLQYGDVVFFSGHVGIYIGNGELFSARKPGVPASTGKLSWFGTMLGGGQLY